MMYKWMNLLNNSRFLHSFKVKGSELHNIIPEYWKVRFSKFVFGLWTCEWLNIYSRIKKIGAVMMYKWMNGLAPEYLTEFFKKCSFVNNYTLRSTSLDNLHVQRPNTNFEKRTFHTKLVNNKQTKNIQSLIENTNDDCNYT
jgi:hypothetical protein